METKTKNPPFADGDGKRIAWYAGSVNLIQNVRKTPSGTERRKAQVAE
ncbi:hypothetical protein HNQ07_004341 [Deinococcus metalli]|uniref:Uncharacterized protein n=1 Tax=Deinococcus metalli TaxID=1141878 RepID=A0A7W8KII0_9DEIO|nr:hypothetical protein [Deinococcus metalli]